jgi:exopolyphosphatase/guanosine-5'-triphosphate,3'-diphosphate pyrophosphatase
MRVAALDLGSNSFHALIADVDREGGMEVVDRAKRMPRIGEDIFRTGAISAGARRRALRALSDLVPVIDRTRPDVVRAVATAAVREARNGREFVREIRARFGIDVSVISGDEEARLSYAGARGRLGAALGHATLFDLGGGSLEAIVGDGERILRTASAPLGVLRALVERPLSDPADPRELRALREWACGTVAAFLQPLATLAHSARVRLPEKTTVADRAFGAERLGGDLGEVILCAGTARAACSVARALGYIPAEGPLCDRISRDTLAALIDRLAALPLAARRGVPGLDPNRADLIVPGAIMLDAILAAVGVAEARVCRAALREGLILEQARAPQTPARGRVRYRARVARWGRRLPYRSATTRAARPAFSP